MSNRILVTLFLLSLLSCGKSETTPTPDSSDATGSELVGRYKLVSQTESPRDNCDGEMKDVQKDDFDRYTEFFTVEKLTDGLTGKKTSLIFGKCESSSDCSGKNLLEILSLKDGKYVGASRSLSGFDGSSKCSLFSTSSTLSVNGTEITVKKTRARAEVDVLDGTCKGLEKYFEKYSTQLKCESKQIVKGVRL